MWHSGASWQMFTEDFCAGCGKTNKQKPKNPSTPPQTSPPTSAPKTKQKTLHLPPPPPKKKPKKKIKKNFLLYFWPVWRLLNSAMLEYMERIKVR